MEATLKTQTAVKWFGTAVLIFIFAGFAALMTGSAIHRSQKSKIRKLRANPETSDVVKIDWKEMYPFAETKTAGTGSSKTKRKSVVVAKYKRAFSKLNANITATENHLPGYNAFFETGRLCRKIWCPGAPYLSSSLVRTEDGYIISRHPVPEDISVLHAFTDSAGSLGEYLKRKRIPFLYVHAPAKLCVEDKDLSGGIKDCRNSDSDLYLGMLRDLGVNVLDLRKTIHEEGLRHRSLFFKTDHHWTMETGLRAARKISNVIADEYGVAVDTKALSAESFTNTVFQRAMFGSGGMTVGRAYAQPEDLVVPVPESNPEISVISPDRKIDITGGFVETVLETDKLNKFTEQDGGYAYEAILHGNRPLTKIVNHGIVNRTKILMIADSFSLVVAPYLALASGSVDLIDVRPRNGNFTGSVRTYLEEYKPDIVIMLYFIPPRNSSFD